MLLLRLLLVRSGTLMARTIIEYWRDINPVTSTLRIRYPLQWPECLYSVPGRKDWPRCRPRHRPTSYPAFLKKRQKDSNQEQVLHSLCASSNDLFRGKELGANTI